MAKRATHLDISEQLFVGVVSSSPDLYNELLTRIENVDVRTSSQRTLLHTAIRVGSVEWVMELLMKGADPCLRDENDMTAMQAAEWWLKNYKCDGERKVIMEIVKYALKQNSEKYDRQKGTKTISSEELDITLITAVSSILDRLDGIFNLLTGELNSIKISMVGLTSEIASHVNAFSHNISAKESLDVKLRDWKADYEKYIGVKDRESTVGKESENGTVDNSAIIMQSQNENMSALSPSYKNMLKELKDGHNELTLEIKSEESMPLVLEELSSKKLIDLKKELKANCEDFIAATNGGLIASEKFIEGVMVEMNSGISNANGLRSSNQKIREELAQRNQSGNKRNLVPTSYGTTAKELSEEEGNIIPELVAEDKSVTAAVGESFKNSLNGMKRTSESDPEQESQAVLNQNSTATKKSTKCVTTDLNSVDCNTDVLISTTEKLTKEVTVKNPRRREKKASSLSSSTKPRESTSNVPLNETMTHVHKIETSKKYNDGMHKNLVNEGENETITSMNTVTNESIDCRLVDQNSVSSNADDLMGMNQIFTEELIHGDQKSEERSLVCMLSSTTPKELGEEDEEISELVPVDVSVPAVGDEAKKSSIDLIKRTFEADQKSHAVLNPVSADAKESIKCLMTDVKSIMSSTDVLKRTKEKLTKEFASKKQIRKEKKASYLSSSTTPRDSTSNVPLNEKMTHTHENETCKEYNDGMQKNLVNETITSMNTVTNESIDCRLADQNSVSSSADDLMGMNQIFTEELIHGDQKSEERSLVCMLSSTTPKELGEEDEEISELVPEDESVPAVGEESTTNSVNGTRRTLEGDCERATRKGDLTGAKESINTMTADLNSRISSSNFLESDNQTLTEVLPMKTEIGKETKLSQSYHSNKLEESRGGNINVKEELGSANNFMKGVLMDETTKKSMYSEKDDFITVFMNLSISKEKTPLSTAKESNCPMDFTRNSIIHNTGLLRNINRRVVDEESLRRENLREQNEASWLFSKTMKEMGDSNNDFNLKSLSINESLKGLHEEGSDNKSVSATNFDVEAVVENEYSEKFSQHKKNGKEERLTSCGTTPKKFRRFEDDSKQESFFVNESMRLVHEEDTKESTDGMQADSNCKNEAVSNRGGEVTAKMESKDCMMTYLNLGISNANDSRYSSQTFNKQLPPENQTRKQEKWLYNIQSTDLLGRKVLTGESLPVKEANACVHGDMKEVDKKVSGQNLSSFKTLQNRVSISPDSVLQETIEAMMAKTVILQKDHTRTSFIRRIYEKMYSRGPSTSILLRFLRFQPSVTVHIDCESETIENMVDEFRDYDGKVVKGSKRQSFADFGEKRVYLGGLVNEKKKEQVIIHALGSSLCIMSMDLAYNNGGKPYAKGDEKKMAQYGKLIMEARNEEMKGVKFLKRIKRALDKKTAIMREIYMIGTLSQVISQFELEMSTSLLQETLPSWYLFYQDQVEAELSRYCEAKMAALNS